ncbi:hypothetical protein ACL58G_03420 [Massilia sp. GER05]|uniref:hypothetical protein n=1 Tax=Massilia sp. GER05 TaxID=3394605 RepID=UPI003F84638D
MEVVQNLQQDELTIVSRSLLRVTADEWDTPEEQFERVRDNALHLLLESAATGAPGFQAQMRRALLLFDCFLRVISEPAISSPVAFVTARFQALQALFYGALGSKRFIDVSETTRINYAFGFYKVLERLNNKCPVLLADHRQKAAYGIPKELVNSFEKLELDSKQVQKLRPYLLTSKSGKEYNVLLGDMVPILGKRFTDAFHDGLRTIARPVAKSTGLRDFGTTFTQFVRHHASMHQPISVELLNEPPFVQTLLVEFMEYHFMKLTRRNTPVQEGTLGSLQKLWSRYQGYWSSLVRQKIVAAPAIAFPAGNPKLLSGTAVAHRRLQTDADGNTTLVTQKLIIPVPLHVTDEEATKLLFDQLKCDFNVVQTWLHNHLTSFFKDYEVGKRLAAEVAALPSDDELQKVGLKPKSSEPSQTNFAYAIKYFKQKHNGYTNTSLIATPIYPELSARGRIPKERLARYLGIPSRPEAMAFMGFLASHDGRFSEAALASAMLCDGTGKQINAVETDAGLILTVLKERDSGDGWHDVLLKEETASTVRLWIQITAPLRKYMQDHNFEGWQNLIIYTGQSLGAPSYFTRSSNINSTFRHFALANQKRLGHLATSVTIPRIRSTRGVIVFLETMDITRMARELGNTNETSLRHYLPDSIWNYFTTRWLRIFQNLLIVEATRDTPYMQRALHFSSAAEMDEFLKNHAVAPLIPRQEKEKASEHSAPPSADKTPNELMVTASPGLFATLLSIAEAVAEATRLGRRLAAHAVYWAEFAKRLKAHVESADFHDRGIKQMMFSAAANTNPANFMEVVCA